MFGVGNHTSDMASFPQLNILVQHPSFSKCHFRACFLGVSAKTVTRNASVLQNESPPQSYHFDGSQNANASRKATLSNILSDHREVAKRAFLCLFSRGSGETVKNTNRRNGARTFCTTEAYRTGPLSPPQPFHS